MGTFRKQYFKFPLIYSKYFFLYLQDYDEMVKLVDDLMTIPNLKFTFTSAIQHQYAFALNRYVM